MNKSISIITILFILSCSSATHDWYHGYKEFVVSNYNKLSQIDNYLIQNPELERIRTIGDKVSFSKYENGDLKQIGLSDNEILNLIPEHRNMLYLSNETGLFLGVGVFTECNNIPCSVGLVKFRRTHTFELCKNNGLSVSQQTCIEPIYKEWFIHYENRS